MKHHICEVDAKVHISQLWQRDQQTDQVYLYLVSGVLRCNSRYPLKGRPACWLGRVRLGQAVQAFHIICLEGSHCYTSGPLSLLGHAVHHISHAKTHLEVQACRRVVGVVLLQLDGRLGIDGRNAGSVLDPVQRDGPPHLHIKQQHQAWRTGNERHVKSNHSLTSKPCFSQSQS